LKSETKKAGGDAQPMENQTQELAMVCWQLQKLVPPSKRWQDCDASELNPGGGVCLDKKNRRIQYRMHKGKPKPGNTPHIFENQTQE
jgi:hypothetical protein